MYSLSNQDCHVALKTELIGHITSSGVEFKLVKLHNSKDDIKFSLHANPNTWSSAGIQTTDYLCYLGFHRSQCAFVASNECYCRLLSESIDLNKFSVAFANSFAALEESERHLEACGFLFDQPEGWGYFYGKPSGTQRHQRLSSLHYGGGDGHRLAKIDSLKKSEDDYFYFVLTFVTDGSGDKGWVFHYRPKHPPVSLETHAALKFLGLKDFDQCPQFDFENCFWRFIQFEEQEDDVFPRITSFVHNGFDSHRERFSKGIERLLSSQALMVPFGMYFLAIERPAPVILAVRSTEPKSPTLRPQAPSGQLTDNIRKRKFEYDVAISFAGTEREYANRLANIARDGGFNVFYDDFYQEQLWGKDLVVHFDNIYRKWSRYAVMFISSEYVRRMWCIHERRSILARMLQEANNEYVLPIRIDDSEVPGLLPTIAYLRLQDYGIDKVGEILVKKLKESES